ncbi:hypothetical protein FOL47_003047 [Perkinsus chesapeaki]|uniref:N-acetyltransferase domain-containing protein n=1 Tax=Perkinsus chesapeaki TaxID=330153 RepID=A0A7J6MA72_PERCH|nr:hypothetical protein FOL47_003047 [Perkinsus chesapeaki]
MWPSMLVEGAFSKLTTLQALTASDLVYGPAQPGDRLYSSLPPLEHAYPIHTWVAVYPKDGRKVVGRVTSYINEPELLPEGTGRLVVVEAINVIRDWQGKGVGTRLLRESLNDIQENWSDVVAAELSVGPGSVNATKLYTRAGFVPIQGVGNYKLMRYTFPSQPSFVNAVGILNPPNLAHFKGPKDWGFGRNASELVPKMCSDDVVVEIKHVYVHPGWRRKGVASAMIPKALDDILVEWPTAVAVQLLVIKEPPGKQPKEEYLKKLYTEAGFTAVPSRLEKAAQWGVGRNASELEYRAWNIEDVLSGQGLKCVKNGRRFVAVDPKARPYTNNVVGYVEYTREDVLPMCIKDQLPSMCRGDDVAEIKHVFVHSQWRKKGVASMMVPKALDNIPIKWPRVIAVQLIVLKDEPGEEPSEEYLKRLYTNAGFTTVPCPPAKSTYMLYKYPVNRKECK